MDSGLIQVSKDRDKKKKEWENPAPFLMNSSVGEILKI